MPKATISIKKGLDLPFVGSINHSVSNAIEEIDTSRVALIASDFVGLKPKMEVKVGDKVKIGTPLFYDKRLLNSDSQGESQKEENLVPFTSSTSGKVTHIHRGERRVLKSIEIEVDGQNEQIQINPSEASTEDIRKSLRQSGLWTHLRTRPFSQVPAFDAVPNSIFVTAMDSNPLAVDPQVIIDRHQDEFTKGLQVLSQLGDINLCVGAEMTWLSSDKCL